MENYEVIKTIGQGSYGKVCLATHRATGRQVALKIFKTCDLKTQRIRKRLTREIEILQKLSGQENIVQFIESFKTPTEVVIVMEYLAGGELFEYVWERDGLTEEQAKPLFLQIAKAIAHCHENGIAHRDLKLENILLDEAGRPKIADFGFSKPSHARLQSATYCGSPLYAAPEMIFARPYLGPECDIWSMGVILYTMLTACMPFDDSNMALFTQYIETSDYPEPEELSPCCRHLIAMMLDSNGTTRASISDVLSHAWLSPPAPLKPVHTCRRAGISHTPAEADTITSKIIATTVAQCECSCHISLPTGRDSAFIEHCEDCGSISPIPTVKHQLYSLLETRKKSYLSTSSSGYSSTDSLSRLSTPSPTKELRLLAGLN